MTLVDGEEVHQVLYFCDMDGNGSAMGENDTCQRPLAVTRSRYIPSHYP